ncbi:protein NCA1-like [Phoenix dactylifera]|uniref:Protein NCA1-like n=1 Tax=Phoenix dactylifera TaxID=42345 RepID=A0A8B9AYE4_PHODC|nr:protein NCA1-like [Phoenix dactylifera]XP_038988863.1 protein NCA1-like [Phoenix dactylifera]XP_038988864.1 protein NCA1-like [Phoenix dactylifera]
MSSVCPFARGASADGGCAMKHEENHSQQQAKCDDNVDTKNSGTASIDVGCPMKHEGDYNKHQADCDDKADTKSNDSAVVSPKCPFGYDSHTFKLGPLSCMICQALLYQSSKCLPCAHKFCKACISRFKDCPLCGADIEKIEPDTDLQVTVDRFINGHARIKRVNADGQEVDGQKNVIYGDVSMERGAFLVQQAMRAFRAQNIESAKSRLSLCAADIREQLQTSDNTSELCSQLGAVLGMLGDCCRAMGDTGSAVTCYEESVEFLSKLPAEDLELVHTLSVSLNKIGDLRYYDGDLKSAKTYYTQSLNVRRNAVKEHPNVSSQVVDVAISLAKVADVDRNLGSEDVAVDGFEEAIECLESLKLDSNEAGLEQRRRSVLDFLHSQLADKHTPVSDSSV